MGSKVLVEEVDSPLTDAKICKVGEIISKLSMKDTLADVGCFDGRFFDVYRSSGVKSVDGYDILPNALELARKKGGARTFLWDFESERAPSPDSSYAVIVCSDVIEHLFETKNLVNECYRILKPSGTCILLTPNLASLWNRYLVFRGKMPLGHPGVALDLRTESQINLAHVRMGTAREWIGLLRSAGFKISNIDGLWSSSLSKIVSLERPTMAHTLVITCSK
ncbi:MAG: class I SAM-dependent methyltransferase [Nitrososphaerales archaeon]